jgi:hypothetical protein
VKETMSQDDHPDLFGNEPQRDLFGADPATNYRPNPDKVRARLYRILAEARAADTPPWGAARLSLYRTIVPQMAGSFPDVEAAQLRFEFEQELARLKAA